MITVLIAKGPNDIEVPCRIFSDMEIAKSICDYLLETDGVVKDNGMVVYNVDLEVEGREHISEKLFTSYYYGCGGVYRLVLMEVPFNAKFVGFNLD